MPVSHNQLANAIRFLTADAIEAASSGHPGMPLGMADVATILFHEFLKFDPANPDWPDRDRLVLSAGHGSMLLYGCLYLAGYSHPTIEDIKGFRTLSSPCAGHPEVGHLPGVECTSGPLGQGLAMAVGMAIAERRLNAQFGPELVDHHTWVIAGDGCLMEGISQEAITLAGHLNLNKLTVLWDDNHITIDGAVNLASSEDTKQRFEAAGWHVVTINGHDDSAIRRAMTQAKTSRKPCMIACKTVIGFGAPTKQETEKCHGSPLGQEEIQAMRKELGWTSESFVIAPDILDGWRRASSHCQGAFESWDGRLKALPEDERDDFDKQMQISQTGLNAEAKLALDNLTQSLLEKPQKLATRKSSSIVLNALSPAMNGLVGGSADLTESNNTRATSMTTLNTQNYGGDYIYYGIREFAMAAIMNGLSLHGGIIPYGGTFLVFSDYCRPAVRLSALQHLRVIYVFTHDSIGLGEDGPTHQPVEHLASLRAMPGLYVFRPADTIECAECWELALNHNGPSALILSRQSLPQLRTQANSPDHGCHRGGYILGAEDDAPSYTIVAAGSEVSVGQGVQQKLLEKGIRTNLVSMPSTELFDAQDEDWKRKILPDLTKVIVIEAGASQSWYKYAHNQELIFCIDQFGASAPGPVLFDHFGLTVDTIAQKVITYHESGAAA